MERINHDNKGDMVKGKIGLREGVIIEKFTNGELVLKKRKIGEQEETLYEKEVKNESI